LLTVNCMISYTQKRNPQLVLMYSLSNMSGCRCIHCGNADGIRWWYSSCSWRPMWCILHFETEKLIVKTSSGDDQPAVRMHNTMPQWRHPIWYSTTVPSTNQWVTAYSHMKQCIITDTITIAHDFTTCNSFSQWIISHIQSLECNIYILFKFVFACGRMYVLFFNIFT
jgi:hypothetical protein